MPQLEGELIETDVLVIGGGISGLVAALSTKRHAGAGTRVSIADSWMIGRTGHAAFSNADMVVVEPDDDLDAVALEIIAGNDGIADQLLVRDVLAMSYARLRDLEAIGVIFPKEQNNRYVRRPTRGLDAARLILPDGGGMELCWRLRCALEMEGVQLLDRIFITGLMRPNGRVAGAVGLHSRSGAFHVLSARATIICTNAVTSDPDLRATLRAPEHCSPTARVRCCATRNSATPDRARRSSILRESPTLSRRARISSTQRANASCCVTSPYGVMRLTCRASPVPWRWSASGVTMSFISTRRAYLSTCAAISLRARQSGCHTSTPSLARKRAPTCSPRRPITP